MSRARRPGSSSGATGELVPAGLVKLGFGGNDLWQSRGSTGFAPGPETWSGVIPVRPEQVAAVRDFGRYRIPAGFATAYG